MTFFHNTRGLEGPSKATSYEGDDFHGDAHVGENCCRPMDEWMNE